VDIDLSLNWLSKYQYLECKYKQICRQFYDTDQQIVPTSTAMSITSEQTWNCKESSGAESAAIASFVNTSNKYSFTAPEVYRHSYPNNDSTNISSFFPFPTYLLTTITKSNYFKFLYATGNPMLEIKPTGWNGLEVAEMAGDIKSRRHLDNTLYDCSCI